MKKFFGFLLALAMLLSITACGSSGDSGSGSGAEKGDGAADPIVFVIAHTNTEENVTHKAMLKFEEYVEANTDGRVDVQIYPNGQLGGERECVEAVELGSVQMTTPTASVMSAYDLKYNLMELPFLFSDYDAVYEAYDGELGEIYSGWMEEHNLLNMGFYCGGFRGISNTKRPVYTPDDLKGLKLRCIESDMFMKLFQLLGTNPTPMSYNEIYTGLEQGTIDGQDNPATLTYTSKFYEALKYFTATNHVALCVPVVVQKNFYEGLDDDIRVVFDEAFAEMVADLREAKKQEEQDSIAAMQAAGIEYTVLTDDQMQLFKEKVTPIYDDYREIVGDDVMDLALSY
jgi:C4-dicarboxylate-binding protein DctP